MTKKKIWFQTDFPKTLDASCAMQLNEQSASPKEAKSEPSKSNMQSKSSETIGPNTSSNRWIKRNEFGRRIGDSHPRSKYTDHEVELILQLRDVGMTIRKIAAQVEIPFSTVGAICSGRSRNQFPSKVTRK